MTTSIDHFTKKPLKESVTQSTTIPLLFWSQVEKYQDRVALREKDFGIWQEVSWADYGERVRACAFGLIALGLEAGDRAVILSEDRREWLYADLGIQCVGGISVGIYATSSAQQCGYIVGHAEARIWIVEDQEQFDKAMTERDGLADLEWIVVMDPKGLRYVDDERVLTFDELLERGHALERVEPHLLDERMAGIAPDDTVILFYTSGTTGTPKGVMHSHRSLLEGIEPVYTHMEIDEEDSAICYLPLCHVAERLMSLINSLIKGYVVNFAESPETVFSDLTEVAPTFFGGVPRTWEKLKARIQIDIAEATWTKRQAYHWALKVGYLCNPYRRRNARLPFWLRGLWLFAHRGVFYKLRERLGLHRVRQTWVGAAPIAPEVLEFFMAIGLVVYEAYGATEMGIVTMTPRDDIRTGLAGALLPGVTYQVTSKRELLFKGPGIMQGYFKDPERTAEVLEGGWYYTGDAGHFDEDGFLEITGRTKDMMITAAGRNIYPQAIENMVKASDYVMDAVLIGEGREYLTLLIVMDEETVSHYAQTHNIPFSTYADLASKPEIVRLIHDEIQGVNKKWSDREQVLDFRILKWELSDEDDELTPTMKVRRSFMCEQYAELIEEMYR